MPQFVYAWPDDNVAPHADIGSSGTLTDYPVNFLVDGNPAIPSRLAATTGFWLFDFGAAQRVDAVALLHHNLLAGLVGVAIQAHVSNTWIAPAMHVDIAMPARRTDGYPGQPWVDLRTKPGYSPSGYRYWRFVVGLPNASLVSLGELLLIRDYRTLPYAIRWGSTRAARRRTVRHETDGGTFLSYDLGATQRRIACEFEFRDAHLAAVQGWLDSTRGGARPFLLVPNTDDPEAWFVVRRDEYAYERVAPTMNRMSLEFEEVGRGLAP